MIRAIGFMAQILGVSATAIGVALEKVFAKKPLFRPRLYAALLAGVLLWQPVVTLLFNGVSMLHLLD